MTSVEVAEPSSGLDVETTHLIRIAAAIAGSDEQSIRVIFGAALDFTQRSRVEEVILQSYLFAGFPRALNAARMWRTFAPALPETSASADVTDPAQLRESGEVTCAKVYGESYEKLRVHIRELHPTLDEWMIVEGYGKVLSRPGLDLKVRELCIVATCAATGQRRQLHSHIRGALNVGASTAEVESVFDAIEGLAKPGDLADGRQLLAHVARS